MRLKMTSIVEHPLIICRVEFEGCVGGTTDETLGVYCVRIPDTREVVEHLIDGDDVWNMCMDEFPFAEFDGKVKITTTDEDEISYIDNPDWFINEWVEHTTN